MASFWSVGDHVLAHYWTYVDGPQGRWSLQRRGPVVTRSLLWKALSSGMKPRRAIPTAKFTDSTQTR